jgi:hypothetical protein
MNKSLISIALLSALATSAYADNRSGFYAGLGGLRVETDLRSVGGGSSAVNAAELFGGYKHNAYIGGELRVGVGVSESNFLATVGTETASVELTIPTYQSIYYRVESANQTAKSYLLLGYSSVELESEFQSRTGSDTEGGLSYGGGIGFVINERGNLNFEYRVLVDTSSRELTTLGVNYDFRF